MALCKLSKERTYVAHGEWNRASRGSHNRAVSRLLSTQAPCVCWAYCAQQTTSGEERVLSRASPFLDGWSTPSKGGMPLSTSKERIGSISGLFFVKWVGGREKEWESDSGEGEDGSNASHHHGVHCESLPLFDLSATRRKNWASGKGKVTRRNPLLRSRHFPSPITLGTSSFVFFSPFRQILPRWI